MLNNLLVSIHIADLHFSAFNPCEQYNILEDQFLNVIKDLPRIDIISVDGDVYDHKLMGNSDGLYYASLFIDSIINIAKMHNATVLIIHGTYSHDADQLKNFYHYMNNDDIDVRIITKIQFEIIHGARILCIPELYGIDEKIYEHFLHYSGYYDEVYMHGTFKGAVYGDNVGNGRLFTPKDFDMCKGFVIGGHVHKPGCHNGYFYYTGCPYRWKFGEEEAKGFLINIHDLNSHQHYVHFQEIISSSYITIELKNIQFSEPKSLIDYINNLKKNKGIDYLKIKLNSPINNSDKIIVGNYFRNSPCTSIEFMDIEQEKMLDDIKINENLSFLLNDNLSDLEKFVQFVNMNEGQEFITIDKLQSILDEQI